MANTIKIRRGLEADRTSITPATGELIYTTDERKLYVGDGSTAGGLPVESDLTFSGDLDVDGSVTCSNFASTGMDDNATGAVVTVSDSGIDVTGNLIVSGGISSSPYYGVSWDESADSYTRTGALSGVSTGSSPS